MPEKLKFVCIRCPGCLIVVDAKMSTISFLTISTPLGSTVPTLTLSLVVWFAMANEAVANVTDRLKKCLGIRTCSQAVLGMLSSPVNEPRLTY